MLRVCCQMLSMRTCEQFHDKDGYIPEGAHTLGMEHPGLTEEFGRYSHKLDISP